MAIYRKKPVQVEAIQLRWDTWNEICDFVPKDYFGGGFYPDGNPDIIGLYIKTLEGTMMAVQNDYVIKGIKGEFYSCKPDIFEATYEFIA